MYMLGVLALGFYALKIPERYFPGSDCVLPDYNFKTEWMLTCTYSTLYFRLFPFQENSHFWQTMEANSGQNGAFNFYLCMN